MTSAIFLKLPNDFQVVKKKQHKILSKIVCALNFSIFRSPESQNLELTFPCLWEKGNYKSIFLMVSKMASALLDF